MGYFVNQWTSRTRKVLNQTINERIATWLDNVNVRPQFPATWTFEGLAPSVMEHLEYLDTNWRYHTQSGSVANVVGRVTESYAGHHDVLEIYDKVSGDYGYWGCFWGDDEPVTGRVEFWVAVEKDAAGWSENYFILRDHANVNTLTLAFDNDGDVSASDSIAGTHQFKMPGAAWRRFCIDFDCAANTYDLYIDGSLVGSGYGLSTSTEHMTWMFFCTSDSAHDINLYIDAVGLSWKGYESGANRFAQEQNLLAREWTRPGISKFTGAVSLDTAVQLGSAPHVLRAWEADADGDIFLHAAGEAFNVGANLYWDGAAWRKGHISSSGALFQLLTDADGDYSSFKFLSAKRAEAADAAQLAKTLQVLLDDTGVELASDGTLTLRGAGIVKLCGTQVDVRNADDNGWAVVHADDFVNESPRVRHAGLADLAAMNDVNAHEQLPPEVHRSRPVGKETVHGQSVSASVPWLMRCIRQLLRRVERLECGHKRDRQELEV